MLAYLILGVTFSVANPIHEATDELRHYRYVRYIADYGQLPVQSNEAGNAQAHHPPLYYATAALISWWVHPSDPLYEPQHNPQWGFRNWEVSTDNKNLYLHGPDEAWPYHDASLASHLARWTTLLWGAGTVALTIAIAWAMLPDLPIVGIAAAALIALNPMFLYLSGAVNNDVPAGLAGAALTYACVRLIRDGWSTRRIVVIGVLFALANLVKFNLVAMLGVIEVALILTPLVNGEDRRVVWKRLLIANGIILGLTALISGWWYVRNTILYGEPTGFLRVTELWGVRDPSAGVNLAWGDLLYSWTTLWARFSYGQIPVPTIFYMITGILCGAGLIGLGIYLIRARDKSSDEEKSEAPSFTRKQWAMLAVLIASVILNFLVLYAYITVSPAGAMGRFFFPGLPAFCVMVALGLIGLLPANTRNIGTAVLSAGMLMYVFATLFGYLIPAYAIPAQATAPDHPLNIQIGDVARILDYKVTPNNLRPSDTLDVTVTWQVLRPTNQPHQVFIHLLNDTGALVAQRDTYTGLGNYPSNWWKPEHIFTETYKIYLPDTTYAPDQVLVSIGLFNEQGRLKVSGKGQGSDQVQLGQINIAKKPGAKYPNEVFVNWDNHFALVGYTIEPRVLYPGQKLFVTLYWKALNPPKDDPYMVFLHVTQSWETRLAGADGNPVSPNTSTQNWESGEVYTDERKIRVPRRTPPGFYTLELGWFSATSGERLNIVADDGHIIDNWIPLNTITVIPEP